MRGINTWLSGILITHWIQATTLPGRKQLGLSLEKGKKQGQKQALTEQALTQSYLGQGGGVGW